jgi:hypothetical protein
MSTKYTSKIDLGNGIVFSTESDTAPATVPDVTQDAGPDKIKLQEDAQKPETNPDAEYDASEHVDVPEDVEKANENTFFGVILKRRSIEAFAKTKGSFSTAESFFKSNEAKQAIAVAKSWAEKHGLSPAAASDFPEKAKKSGFTSKSLGGFTLGYHVLKSRCIVDIYFKNAKGAVTTKRFGTFKIGEGKPSASSDSTNPTNGSAPAKVSEIDKLILAAEADDPIDSAFTDDAAATPPAEAPVAEGAAPPPVPEAETPPAPEAIPSDSDVTPEEIDEEVGTGAESYLAALTKIRHSREEADAAVAQIEDKEIDEVVGDTEGDSVEEIPETTPAPASDTPPAEGAVAETDEQKAEKALESYIARL